MDITDDQGIFAFVKVAGLQQIAIDGQSLYHQFGDGKNPLSGASLLRAIHSCNFKAKRVRMLPNNINISALPAIGLSRYGYFVIVGVNKDKQYLIIDPQTRAIKKLSFQQARISIQRLGDILNANPEQSDQNTYTALPTVMGSVVFEKVCFRYGSSEPLRLNNISFSANNGQCIGIVGRSGSGKSTLTKLIQRLYTRESGRILIDGVDMSSLSATWLRQNIGVVL